MPLSPAEMKGEAMAIDAWDHELIDTPEKAAEVVARMVDPPLTGMVAHIFDPDPATPPQRWIAINLGAHHGVNEGDRFEVQAPDRLEINDPDGVEGAPVLLGTIGVLKGVFVVAAVRRAFAVLKRDDFAYAWAAHQAIFPMDPVIRVSRGYRAPSTPAPNVPRGRLIRWPWSRGTR